MAMPSATTLGAAPAPYVSPGGPSSGLLAMAPGFTTDAAGAYGAVPLVGQTWRIVDSDQAEFELTFEPEGRVSGPSFSDGQRWTLEGDTLWLVYETMLGGQVARRGRFVGSNEIQGDAESSSAPDGRRWTWRAVRIR